MQTQKSNILMECRNNSTYMIFIIFKKITQPTATGPTMPPLDFVIKQNPRSIVRLGNSPLSALCLDGGVFQLHGCIFPKMHKKYKSHYTVTGHHFCKTPRPVTYSLERFYHQSVATNHMHFKRSRNEFLKPTFRTNTIDK